MARVCTNLDFDCTHNRAICASEVHYYPVEVSKMTRDEILDELKELKENKCKLETAHEKGWLNADRRLEELRGYIEDRLDALEKGGAATPWMGCGPESAALEDQGKKEARSSAIASGSAATLLALLAALH
jgi:hypothetical protein